MEKITIRTAQLPNDLPAIKRLWLEYLVWGNAGMLERYGVHPHDPEKAVELDLEGIGKFQPPEGQMLIALLDDVVCGVGSLKKIRSRVGEIKRMYVDPAFRGRGAGRALLEGLLSEAKKAGYTTVRLDSPKFMTAAHALYRSFGFRDIPPYPEMEIPAEFKEFLLFMELDLE